MSRNLQLNNWNPTRNLISEDEKWCNYQFQGVIMVASCVWISEGQGWYKRKLVEASEFKTVSFGNINQTWLTKMLQLEPNDYWIRKNRCCEMMRTFVVCVWVFGLEDMIIPLAHPTLQFSPLTFRNSKQIRLPQAEHCMRCLNLILEILSGTMNPMLNPHTDRWFA